MLKNAVLSMWYNKKSYPQGKFFWAGKKPYFIANIDDAKLFRKFNGYAISKRLLDKFTELKIRNLIIIYRFVERNTIYITNPSTFKTKGILVAFGGHSQYILPLKNWEVHNTDFKDDPKDLPVVDLEKWGKDVEYQFVGNTAVPVKKEEIIVTPISFQQSLFL
ncbi:MAG TPA: hypothetical protein VNW29_04085 [Candidatus Sulfotelmatobacter sp.]|nr:hypothetical protein [Candidatus Sulfotelmatobacter sp.]